MSADLSPYERAWQTLADHAIQPQFRRSGNQIAGLIMEAIVADRAARTLDPEEGFDKGIGDLLAYSAPCMTLTKKGHLKCPHCGKRDQISELDNATRENEAEWDAQERKLTINQGDAEFSTLSFRCTACSQLVNLPSSITVDWI